jgi:hypothetical protein
MKDFTRSRGRLRSLPLPARVVYSVFLLFTLAAMAATAWLGQQMVGADLSRLGNYYAGKPPPGAQLEQAAAPSGAGPAMDLPPEAETAPAAEPMPLRKLLEVTHFHLFSMPVYLLILSHLFMLARGRDATKVLWITLGTLGVAGHVAAPWLARADAASSLVLYGGTGALLGASFGVMSIVPLWDMWAPLSTRDKSQSDSSLDS